MKKVIALVIVGFILFAVNSLHAAEKIRIATEGAYPPFNYVDPDGNLKGFDVDLSKALCKAMGVECELVVQDWDGMIPGLLAGKFDAIIACMGATEERKKAVSFTRPYCRLLGRFVGHKDADFEISKENLKGKRIGVQRGTTYSKFLKGVYGDIIEIKTYGSIDEHNLDLKAGRLDAVVGNEIFMGRWLESPDGKNFKFLSGPLRHKLLGTGEANIAVRKENKGLKVKLDKALQQLIKNGKHQEIASKHFAVNVYDY
jgi:lysine-arginine-ornithine-binding protein